MGLYIIEGVQTGPSEFRYYIVKASIFRDAEMKVEMKISDDYTTAMGVGDLIPTEIEFDKNGVSQLLFDVT